MAMLAYLLMSPHISPASRLPRSRSPSRRSASSMTARSTRGRTPRAAKVDAIAWNGTAPSWLGFDRDEQLCERIRAATGIPGCTSVLEFARISSDEGPAGGPRHAVSQRRPVRSWRTGGRRGLTAAPNSICGSRIISRSRRSLRKKIAQSRARRGAGRLRRGRNRLHDMRGAGLANRSRGMASRRLIGLQRRYGRAWLSQASRPRASRDRQCFRISGQRRSGQFRRPLGGANRTLTRTDIFDWLVIRFRYRLRGRTL